MTVPMEKSELARILVAALDRYVKWEFSWVKKALQEPICEQDSGCRPEPNHSYWQIEIRSLQEWQEQNVDVVQMFAEISDGHHSIGAVIDYYSNGEVLIGNDLVEFVDGVATPLFQVDAIRKQYSGTDQNGA